MTQYVTQSSVYNICSYVFKTLSCLVRTCKKDKDCEERVVAAETLAYLTEVDTELQRYASISDHLISSLTSFLKYQPEQSSAIMSSSVISMLEIKKVAER